LLILVFFTGYIGSEVFILHWLNPWLDKNYGKAARSIKPHGIIILDTVMEYNTSSNSQKLPDGAAATVSSSIIFLFKVGVLVPPREVGSLLFTLKLVSCFATNLEISKRRHPANLRLFLKLVILTYVCFINLNVISI
jgi:hypothetical protein